MTLSSMTGYARASGSNAAANWSWDIKSVNGRNLETRFRLPPSIEFLEIPLRKIFADGFSRGNFFASLTLNSADAAGHLTLNDAALASVIAAIRSIEEKIACAPPRPESILTIKGVLNTRELAADDSEREALAADLTATFRAAVGALQASRRDEGAALQSVLEKQIAAIDQLVVEAAQSAGAQLEAIRRRIAAQIDELGSGRLDTDRIDQEAAMIALRADVREELDRLRTHSAAARLLLAENGPVGRKLDFLSQEFNREANTLASKAIDMDLKRIGLELKSVIDQFREQVQNIE